MRAQDAEQALRHVCAAAALYPDALTVSSNLLAWLRAKSPEAAAPLEAARLERVPRPPEIRVEFQDGICLEGVSVEPRVVTRGGRLRLTGFWRGFTSRNAAAWVAFVHFERNGKPIFQDDHHLLADALVADRSNELDAREVVREERTIRVPADAPAGDYSLTIGLYNAVTGARSAVKTDAPARRRAVLAPLQITVRP
jgi:hypothetical protein